ncbi:MAG: hypothetical protein WCK49_04980 [Myxococcaceae bacterium]
MKIIILSIFAAFSAFSNADNEGLSFQRAADNFMKNEEDYQEKISWVAEHFKLSQDKIEEINQRAEDFFYKGFDIADYAKCSPSELCDWLKVFKASARSLEWLHFEYTVNKHLISHTYLEERAKLVENGREDLIKKIEDSMGKKKSGVFEKAVGVAILSSAAIYLLRDLRPIAFMIRFVPNAAAWVLARAKNNNPQGGRMLGNH